MNDFDTLPTGALPDHRVTAMRQLLESEISRSHRSPRPMFIGIGAVIVAASAGAAGYAYAARTAPVTDKNVASCYTVASLSAGPESFTQFAQATRAGSPTRAQIDNALSVCADFWRQGILRPGPDGARGAPNPAGNYPVPALVTCVLPDGTAAVFPGKHGTCATLNLPNATP